MSSTVSVAASVAISDGVKDTIKEAYSVSLLAALAKNGKRETVTLAAGFTALAPPTGARGVMIMCQAEVSLTIKGVTGDTGIAIAGATANQIPALIPLGTTPSIGITNAGSSTTVDVIWF